ncbi:MAG: hypothetical protein NTZ41_08900 [Sphingobacteriales bacterium]|jgi:hypothetical protein|nr:hypothetical protein [Sphingobacteriales bacterium]
MKLTFFIGCLLICSSSTAQDSTLNANSVIKDERFDLLGKQMTAYNESLATKTQMVNGYRLMLLNTTDRPYAMKVRSQLMQQYPDQKVYISFVSPYIKLKFGNYPEKADAEKARKMMLAAKVVSGNIYLVPEMVEQKQEKPAVVED